AYTCGMTSGADYRVDLSIYNGPLDLLLHLIREREVDIQEIPIAEITEQFLSHIEVVKRIDVERAGDFLLMAATLMLIKSRMLLPRAEAGEDELEEELDPRTDLVNQLLEYKAFRDRSRALADAGEERLHRYEGGLAMPNPEAPDAGKLLEDLGVHDLLLAFEKLMAETLAEVDFQVFGENLPVGDVREQVTGHLRALGGSVPFRDLFLERRDRYYIVSVFCALLEMLRRQVVTLESGHHATDLRVHLVESAGDAAGGRMSEPPPPPPSREDRLPRIG
ncbi:MAG: segregation and condensation protein A, partial [Planctomycetota bacterium]